MTGTAVSARTWRSTSRPRTFGSPRSSTTSSGASSAILSSAVAPSLGVVDREALAFEGSANDVYEVEVVVNDEDRHARRG